MMAHWRDALDGAVAEMPAGRAVRGRPTAGPGDRGDGVLDRVGTFQAGAPCPAVAMVADPDRFDERGAFRESVFTARREVALVALREAPAGMPAHEMVTSVLNTPDSLRRGVADWLRSLEPAAVAALRADAVSWVVDARALAARRGEPQWHEPRALAYTPRSLSTALTAQVDAVRTVRAGTAQDRTHLLVLRPRSSPADRRVAGRTALLWSLVRGEEPASVVLAMRATLERVRFAVDGELLSTALGEAVVDLGFAAEPGAAPRRVGPHCRYCRILGSCADGSGHLESLKERWAAPWDHIEVASGVDPTT